MNKEFITFQTNLTYYINTVLLDLKELENIALKVAAKEVKEKGYSGPLPTTDPFGGNHEPQQFVASRCTIPMTMMCFSVIDFIGLIILEGPSNNTKKNDINEFIKHSQCFFKKLAKNEDLKNDTTSKKFQDIFRHSIMHTFLPAPNFNIGYSVSYTKLINEYALFVKTFDGNEILNIKYFVSVLKKGLKKFREIIQNENECSQRFCQNYSAYLKKSDAKTRVS